MNKDNKKTTTYHVGDIFKVRKMNALAVITEVNNHITDKYSVTYIDPKTHETITSLPQTPYTQHLQLTLPPNAWWTPEEMKKSFIEKKIFKAKL